MKQKKQTFYKTTTKGRKVPSKFTPFELETALYEAERNFEFASCHFYLMGQTLKSIKENGVIDGDKVELGVAELDLTPEVRGFLRGWGFELTDKSLRLLVHDVPVQVKVMKDKSLFEHPDFVWYGPTQFQIPNPWRAAL